MHPFEVWEARNSALILDEICSWAGLWKGPISLLLVVDGTPWLVATSLQCLPASASTSSWCNSLSPK